jgi:alanine-synthesizing transaminase
VQKLLLRQAGRRLSSGFVCGNATALDGGRRHGVNTGVPATRAVRQQPDADATRSKPVIEDFHRIKRLPPYVFAEVNRLKAAARARGADIIDLGMGNPDLPTPQHIVDKLVETVAKPRTHRYSASKGIPGLRRAQAAYYERRFGVKLNPETQVVATLGSKEGFANMAQAITAPGDVILVPNPTYPIHEFGFLISGAAMRHIPAGNGDQFLAAVDKAVRHSIPRPLAMVLSYPSNPTAMTASLEFYKAAVDLAKKLDLIILSDIAYAEIYFDGNPPPSVLQVPGAMDVAVEFTSLSKTYNMPGWRMGFAVGNERLIGALARVKSYLDYGAFTPIQVAAAAALNGPQDCVNEIRKTYQTRRDVLVESFARAGWTIPPPPATMFAWCPLPEAYKAAGSVEFTKLLIEKADVAVSPGLGFGEYGEGYVRIALVENEHRIRQAARSIKKFLAQPRETLHNVVPISQKASR